MIPLIAIAVACASLVVYRLLQVGKRAKDLPPGPPTVPLLGNLHQIPQSGAHFQFTKWAQEYGGIFSLKLGSGTMIVVTDRQIARELLDGKGANFSDRPDSYVTQHLITGGDHPLVMKYGPKWRRARKTLHQEFYEARCDEQFLPVVDAEAAQMMRDCLVQPADFMLHAKRFTNSILMSLVYGIRTPTAEAGHMQDLYHMIEQWAEVGETGATPPVDILPIFKWLPERMWNRWRSRARAVHEAMNALYGGFVDRARARRSLGLRNDGIVDTILDEHESGAPREEGELNFICGVMVEAGSDTSSSMILACLHAMTAYPDVQRKVHAELDAAIPADRSPTWHDYARLPYVAQVIKETMRWRPTAPLAFPHANLRQDSCRGMTIPQGSIVVLNTWGLHHDPNMSPPPDVFEPARFAGHDKPAADYLNVDPARRDHYGYGAGRRVCPGVHLAERNLFIGIAKLLWAFSFEPDVDADGRPCEINVDFETAYTHGFVHCPKPFPCVIRVRGEKRREVILREFEQANQSSFAKFRAL